MYDKILLEIESVLLKHKNIGLLVSGGFDSTLLSYIVHDIICTKKLENRIEFFTVPRYDDSIVHARRVIDFLYEKFNISAPWHLVGNPDLHFTQQVSSGITEVLNNHIDIDMLLTGDNIVPPENEVPGGPPRRRGIHPRLCKPFFDYRKNVIVQLAIDKGLTDVMEISHTCTESKTLRCNICWQCRERAWAFKQCGYTDPGTM